MFTTLSLALALVAINTAHAQYSLVKEYAGSNFFDNWIFQTNSMFPGGVDPTNGFVNYTDFETAKANDLAGFLYYEADDSTHAYLGVDHANQAPEGRNSIRITSKDKFSAGALVIADIWHTPLGICGTWPAFWMTGQNWPDMGEIDIMEGVNDDQHNSITLHTGPNCQTSNATRAQQGVLQQTNCDANAEGNTGCGVHAPTTSSPLGSRHGSVQHHAASGHGFNSQGGGIYATLWTNKGISVYLFPRNNIPQDIHTSTPNPSTWTQKPLARFDGPGCDFAAKFRELQLVLNTDLCGDWAGAEEVWGASQCARRHGGSCEEFVAGHPEAFGEAYWDVASIRVFQAQGKGKREVWG